MKDVFLLQNPSLDRLDEKDWPKCCKLVKENCTQQVKDTLRLMPKLDEGNLEKLWAYMEKIYVKKEVDP